jgi:hypothetical protein
MYRYNTDVWLPGDDWAGWDDADCVMPDILIYISSRIRRSTPVTRWTITAWRFWIFLLVYLIVFERVHLPSSQLRDEDPKKMVADLELENTAMLAHVDPLLDGHHDLYTHEPFLFYLNTDLD